MVYQFISIIIKHIKQSMDEEFVKIIENCAALTAEIQVVSSGLGAVEVSWIRLSYCCDFSKMIYLQIG